MKTNCHIKVGDNVKVITGTYKGKTGTIESIIFKKSILFLKEISPRIKYVKNTQGGEPKKIDIQIPIHISNVMLYDKETNITSKIGYKIVESKKYRYFKKSGKIVS